MKKLICLLLVLCLSACVGGQAMAIEFTNVANEYISFPDVAASGLVQKTITGWIDLDSFGDTSVSAYILNKGGWAAYIGTSSQSLFYTQLFTTAPGAWKTANSTITTSLHHIAISYDNSSTANDPILYIDGESMAVSESLSPSGSLITDVGQNLQIGNSGGKSIDGKLQDVRIYNRILSAQEIKILAASRSMNVVRSGLVFHAPFIGAQNKQIYAGALAEADKLRDVAGGLLGTPYGNPIAVPNTIQRIN